MIALESKFTFHDRIGPSNLASRAFDQFTVGVFQPPDHGNREGHGDNIKGLITHKVVPAEFSQGHAAWENFIGQQYSPVIGAVLSERKITSADPKRNAARDRNAKVVDDKHSMLQRAGFQ